MLRVGAGGLPAARASRHDRRRPRFGQAIWCGPNCSRRRRRDERAARDSRARARRRRPDQHPVHERHHRSTRRAQRSHTTTSSTTPTRWPVCLGYTDADRVCIPVPLYHCFGMGIGNLGCVTTGATMVYPAATFEPVPTMQAVAGRALHEPLRRAHDVDRAARASSIRTSSTSRRCAPGSWVARRAPSK